MRGMVSTGSGLHKPPSEAQVLRCDRARHADLARVAQALVFKGGMGSHEKPDFLFVDLGIYRSIRYSWRLATGHVEKVWISPPLCTAEV